MTGLVLMFAVLTGASVTDTQFELTPIGNAIAENKFQRIAACPSAISVDKQRGKLTVAGTVGPQARVFGQAVESQLRQMASQRFVLVESAAANAVFRSFLNSLNTGTLQSARDEARKFQVDGLVITSVEENPLAWNCTVELIGAQTGRTLASIRFVEKKSLSSAAYSGKSFEARRFSDGYLQPTGLRMWGEQAFAKGKAAEELQYSLLSPPAKHPLSKGFNSPQGFDIYVNGSLREMQPRGDKMYVALEIGEEFLIKAWNNSGRSIQLAIYVDGVNTIGRKFEAPDQTPYSRSWVIDPTSGAERRTIGWFDPSDPNNVGKFRVAKREEGIAFQQSPEGMFGTITAVAYSHGEYKADVTPPKQIAERLKASPVISLIAEGGKQALNVGFAEGTRGTFMAGYTVHYRTKAELDNESTIETLPPNQTTPGPPPIPPAITETTLDTDVSNLVASTSETNLETSPSASENTGAGKLIPTAKGSLIAQLVDSAVPTRPKSQPRPVTAGELMNKNLQITSSNLFQFEGVKKQLQLVLVVDGTDSMGAELEGLRKNLQAFIGGLKEKMGSDATISVGIVIFRDQEAPSGMVKVESAFTTDIAELQKKVNEIKPETGAPRYEEVIDQGIEAALKLDWAPRSKDNDVTRWMIVCGDAPPYAEGKPTRKVTTDQLVKMANEKGVQIYTLLVNSGATDPRINNEELLAVAQKARPLSQAFMSTLSTKTGGRFLDFWDAKAVSSMLEQGLRFTQKMDRITQQEIDRFKSQNNGEFAKVSVAVLPQVSFETLKTGNVPEVFDSTKPSARAATAIRESLRGIPGMLVVGPADVQAAVSKVIKNNPTTEKDFIKQVSRELNAGYVLAGDYQEESDAKGKATSMAMRLFKQLDGSLIAEAKKTVKDDKDAKLDVVAFTVRELSGKAASALKQDDDDKEAIAVFESVGKDRAVGDQVVSRLSDEIRAQRSMLVGLDYLEKALSYFKNSSESESSMASGRSDLDAARISFEEALGFDKDNAYCHLLLASCYFNLETTSDGSLPAKVKDHLEAAYKNRNNKLFANSPVVNEIEAEYALLVTKDINAAQEGFNAIIKRQEKFDGKARFVLRAHWMLAGIALGDWGVKQASPKSVDLSRARTHILTIMSGWPNSPEAKFYAKALGQGSVPVGGQQLANSF